MYVKCYTFKSIPGVQMNCVSGEKQKTDCNILVILIQTQENIKKGLNRHGVCMFT